MAWDDLIDVAEVQARAPSVRGVGTQMMTASGFFQSQEIARRPRIFAPASPE